MAGRCNCSSVAAVGAAAQGSSCVSVTGAGTPGSPFVVGTKIYTPVGGELPNLLQCLAGGLYAQPLTPQLRVSKVLSAIVGGAPPAPTTLGPPNFLIIGDTAVVTVDANQNISVPIAGGGFPNGVITAVGCNGDPSTVAFVVNFASSPSSTISSLAGHVEHVSTAGATTSLAGTLVRVNYICIGW